MTQSAPLIAQRQQPAASSQQPAASVNSVVSEMSIMYLLRVGLGHSKTPYPPVSGHAGASSRRRLPPAPGRPAISFLVPPSDAGPQPELACFQGDDLGGLAGACVQRAGGRVKDEDDLLLAQVPSHVLGGIRGPAK